MLDMIFGHVYNSTRGSLADSLTTKLSILYIYIYLIITGLNMFDYFYNKVKERFPTSEIIITDRGGEGVIHFFVADDLFKEMTRPARVQFLQGVVKGIMGEEFYEAMYVLTGLTISERNQWFD